MQHQHLKELLNYDPETGIFTWTKFRGNRYTGKVAGSVRPSGHIVMSINWKQYSAARLAWLYMTKRNPKTNVRHINGIEGDNRWSNLETRSVKVKEPVELWSTNTTGVRGVSWNQRDQRYVASISIKGIKHRLGNFKTLTQAAAVRKAAEQTKEKITHET